MHSVILSSSVELITHGIIKVTRDHIYIYIYTRPSQQQQQQQQQQQLPARTRRYRCNYNNLNPI